MLNPVIAYMGGDKAFEQALGLSAGSLGITLNVVTSSKNPANLATENLIFIIDGDSTISEEAIHNSLNISRQSNLVVLAISNLQNNKLSIPEWLWKLSVDVFIKPVPQELLDNRLNLYIELLQAVANSPASDNTASLLKENHSLSRQVAHLKQHLGQIDMDLHVRSKVIDKINRISHLSRQINCLDLDKIASVCIEEIPPLISAKFASLYRFDPDKKVLHLLRHNHPYMIDRMVVLDKHEKSPMVMAIKNKKLLLIKDLTQWALGEDMTVNRLYARNYNSNSCIIAPLLSGVDVLGVLNLADHIDGPYFDQESDGPPVELFCEIIGSAMSNIMLYDEVRQRAQTDSMTGLVNHQTFYDELDKEVQRSKRYGGSLSLIMIDLDNLKQINDEFGHRAGDAVLLHVSEQINRCTRTNDVAARYGGDEFAIILPNTSVAEALVVAERIAQMVSGQTVKHEGKEFHASVSVGVGQYRKGASIEDFMNESDSALFEAKSSGKNCIQVFETAKK
ncbi:diguanylate cyclase [Planctomycetota bacterium]